MIESLDERRDSLVQDHTLPWATQRRIKMKKRWRLRSDLVVGNSYGGEKLVPEMADFRGKEVTFRHVCIREDAYWNWTPEMFEDEPVPDCPFRRGDVVEVWDRDDDEEPAVKRIFVGYTPGAREPYICVYNGDERNFVDGNKFSTTPWKYCRPRRPPDLKEGDPVIVWDEPEHERRRVFAGWSHDGKIRCFSGGLTKWTSEGRTTPWNHWRLPTEEELK